MPNMRTINLKMKVKTHGETQSDKTLAEQAKQTHTTRKALDALRKIRLADRASAAADYEAKRAEVTTHPPIPRSAIPVVRPAKSSLVSDHIIFDDTQIAAVEGMENQRYACMTGAAGTGKTTTLKRIIDSVIGNIDSINIAEYWKTQKVEEGKEPKEFWIPSIALCAYTGRACEMIKKNFPPEWHANIMTIHRLLAYQPEYYEDMDESGEWVTKRRFIPTYDANNKLPWDFIVIDEAGMLGTDLWFRLEEALEPKTRIFMIGDINQLPPVQGTSIFGFSMLKWPSFELTHIHRQKGESNPIVDNAWKILQGQKPEQAKGFQMIKLPDSISAGNKMVRQALLQLNDKGLYVPMRDTVITAINGDVGSKGEALGQMYMNHQLTTCFNKDAPRYIIDAMRDRKNFAVGDKVMVTKNDHEQGITNGMTGEILEIVPNEDYTGDPMYVGLESDVIAARSSIDYEENIELMSLEEFTDDLNDMESEEKEKASRERGPASHSVTVRFSDDITVIFRTYAEVHTLQLAYVVTCHKMQGGESPLVVIIMHQQHKQMYSREWLYTAVTRASEKVLLFYTDIALAAALNRQRIKGRNLQQKIEHFNKIQKSPFARDLRLPDPEEV